MTEHELDYAREREAEAQAGEREAKQAKAQHTPGPWHPWSAEEQHYPDEPRHEEWTVSVKADASIGRSRKGANEGADIAYLNDCHPITAEQQAANARLIAAAPVLLVACEAAFAALDFLCSSFASQEGRFGDALYETARTARDAVDQALTQATGRED
jgi:hypothetical protein